ncbi:MAG: hypothetical protein IJ019_03810 [Alphaproteobacteria bacterium]|nr:hypothetical protein [Alphaproteobacteria bacterium]
MEDLNFLNGIESLDDYSLKRIYTGLAKVIIERPELAEKSLEKYSQFIQSDKNNSHSLETAYNYLKAIAYRKPQYTDKVLDIFDKGLKSGKNNSFSHEKGYEALSEVPVKTVDLLNKSLNLCKDGIKSDNPSRREYAAKCMEWIKYYNPEIVNQSVDVAELMAKTKDKLHKKDVKTEEASQQPKAVKTMDNNLPNKGKSGYGN